MNKRDSPYVSYDQIGVPCTGSDHVYKYSQQNLYMESGNSVSSGKSVVECVEITTKEQKNTLIKENPFVVIGLHATWCGPCKRIAPAYQQLAEEYTSRGKIIFCKEDIDLELSQDIEIEGVPTFLIYGNGRLVDISPGASIKAVEKKLTNLLPE